MPRIRPILSSPLTTLVPRARLLLTLCCCALLAACAGEPPIDWEARQYSYTYDDAVAEYGEPLACTDHTDGGRICSWRVDKTFAYADQMVIKFDAGVFLESHRVGKFK